ncbi:MAG TPA: hypothetical protein VGL66_07760 [Caulobacteraceae bacterium]
MTRSIHETSRRGALAAAFGVLGGAALAGSARAQQVSTTPNACNVTGFTISPPVKALIDAAGVSGDAHDWDYLMGEWSSVQRRMKKRWTSNPEWEAFPARTVYQKFYDGAMNVDETDFPTKGWGGLTLRTLSPATKLWSVYWVSTHNPTLTAPMVGGYKDDRATFYGDDTDDGVPIIARVYRIKARPDTERWEQAFSKDGGKTWETNWTADFSRVKRA